jgi:hypothetical protein
MHTMFKSDELARFKRKEMAEGFSPRNVAPNRCIDKTSEK